MIVVTGATGNVGGGIARLLVERGHQVRLLVRDPARAPDLAGAEVAVGDYGDPEALAVALHPGDRVFMVSVHAPFDERVRLHRRFVDAAVLAGVAQIVYLSYLSASHDSPFVHARSHKATEEMIEASGVPSTFLCPSAYVDGLAAEFEDGVIRGPAGDQRVSWVARDDIPFVAAAVLAEAGHENAAYSVTGPAALTLAETAALVSGVCGAPFRYENESREDGLDWRSARGYPDWIVDSWLGEFEAIGTGAMAEVSDTIARVGGHVPTTVRDYVARHRADYLARRKV